MLRALTLSLPVRIRRRPSWYRYQMGVSTGVPSSAIVPRTATRRPRRNRSHLSRFHRPGILPQAYNPGTGFAKCRLASRSYTNPTATETLTCRRNRVQLQKRTGALSIMVTILHTADVHLDRAFSGPGMSQGIAAARRQELREAVRRLVDLALELRAGALTIGGDLYEHERATMDTGNFLRQQFERVAPARVFIAAGNHDPHVPGSLYERVEWPDNVVIFREPRFQPASVVPGVTLWGAGHNGPALRQNLLSAFRVGGQGQHLLLFHGSDTQSVPEGKAAHAPFLPEDVVATGAAFALLGHYHSARLHPQATPVFAYPGSPEPLDFSEEGDHCVLRLDVSPSGVAPQLLPFGQVSYSTRRLDVTPMVTSDEARSAIAGLSGEGGIMRVVLEGQLQPEVDLDVPALYNAFAERFAFLDIVDRTEPGYDFDELAEESTTKGAFVRLMRSRIEGLTGDEAEVARQALVYGLRAFERR